MLAGLGPKERPTSRNPLAGELARTKKRAETELAKLKLAVEIQGKAANDRSLAAHLCVMKSWPGRPLTSATTGAFEPAEELDGGVLPAPLTVASSASAPRGAINRVG